MTQRRLRRFALAALASALLLGALVSPVVMAATPEPSRPPSGDPRSEGQGPGLVGEPLLAVGGVLLIGAGAAVATAAWLKATSARR